MMRSLTRKYLEHFLIILPITILVIVLRLFVGDENSIIIHFDNYRSLHQNITLLMQACTDFGNIAFYPIYGFLLLKGYRKNDSEAKKFVLTWIAAQLIIILLFGFFIKSTIGRPRPWVGGDCMPFSFGTGHNSFPSGHTAEIIGNCVPIAQRYKSLLYVSFLSLYTVLIGFTRIYLSAHYISDVVGGIILGSLSAYVSLHFRMYTHKKSYN